MNELIKYKIGDLITLKRGFDITKKEQDDGIYPVVSSSGITSYHNQYKVKGPGVIIGRKGTLGKAYYIDTDYWPHDTSLWVENFKGNNPYYIYCLLSLLPLKKLDTGSANPTLNRNFVHQIETLKLPLELQNEITKVIISIDKKIDINNRIIDELEEMTQILYDYWFVQFDFPDDKGKPYHSSGGEMVWNEQLKREIPKKWKDTTLSTFIKEEKGGDWGKEQKIGNYTEKVICIRGADFPGLVGKKNLKAPTRFILKKNLVKRLNSGDIIVEISGGSPTQSTGRISYINNELLSRFDIPIVTSNFCKSFTIINENWQYWFYLLWEKLYCAGVFFKYEGKTTGIKNLLFDVLCTDYHIIYPDEDTVKKFNNFAKPLFANIQKLNQENQELIKLRDWLLPMLMNGQITVK